MSLKEGLTVIPAKTPIGELRNCIEIDRAAAKILGVADVISAAVQSAAFIDNSGDEAGDDQYAVKFSGGDEQELLDQDGIMAKLRQAQGEDGE